MFLRDKWKRNEWSRIGLKNEKCEMNHPTTNFVATVDLKYRSSGASIHDTTCFLPVRVTRPTRFLLPFNKFTGDGTAGSAMAAGVCGGAATGSRWTLFEGGPTWGMVTPRKRYE